MPERPEFEFLRDRKFRVRTIKLCGQVSQGLVLPLDILPAGNYKLGDDVTELLGVAKYDPQAQQEALLLTKQPKTPANPIAKFLMRFKWYRKLFMKPKRKGGFPDWIVKTDETRIQNLTTLFDIESKRGRSSPSPKRLTVNPPPTSSRKSPAASMNLASAVGISDWERPTTALTGRLPVSMTSKMC